MGFGSGYASMKVNVARATFRAEALTVSLRSLLDARISLLYRRSFQSCSFALQWRSNNERREHEYVFPRRKRVRGGRKGEREREGEREINGGNKTSPASLGALLLLLGNGADTRGGPSKERWNEQVLLSCWVFREFEWTGRNRRPPRSPPFLLLLLLLFLLHSFLFLPFCIYLTPPNETLRLDSFFFCILEIFLSFISLRCPRTYR